MWRRLYCMSYTVLKFNWFGKDTVDQSKKKKKCQLRFQLAMCVKELPNVKSHKCIVVNVHISLSAHPEGTVHSRFHFTSCHWIQGGHRTYCTTHPLILFSSTIIQNSGAEGETIKSTGSFRSTMMQRTEHEWPSCYRVILKNKPFWRQHCVIVVVLWLIVYKTDHL